MDTPFLLHAGPAMNEFIYILTNPEIPDFVKIGRTTKPEQRVIRLSSQTGAPVPF